MSLEIYSAPQQGYASGRHREYQDYQDSFDPNEDKADGSAALFEASGAYSPPMKAAAADAGKTAQELSAKAASVESSDASVSLTVADAAENKEEKSGIGKTMETIAIGGFDEIFNHPLRFLGNAVMGIAVGAVTAAAVAAAGTVGLAVAGVAAGYGIYKLGTSVDDWLEDGKIIANADQHTDEEVAAARANLIEVGHGTADFMASAGGGVIGGVQSALMKEVVETGISGVGSAFRTYGGPLGEYLQPVAKSISGTTDTAMVRAGAFAGTVGDAVSNVATPVLAKGAQIAGYVADKVAAVAEPVRDQFASISMTVGQKAAPYVNQASELGAKGIDKASGFATKGWDKVTNVATTGADKLSTTYLTVADAAITGGGKVADYAAKYFDKTVNVAADVKDKAMMSAAQLADKVAARSAMLAENNSEARLFDLL